MAEAAFYPTGNTVLVAAATTAPTGVQAGTKDNHYRAQNDGNVTAFIAFGADAATAQANAVIPTAGNPKASIPLPPGAIEVVSAPPGSFWSGKTASGTANVYVTPGTGV